MGLSEEEKAKRQADLDEWFRLVQQNEEWRKGRELEYATNKEGVKNQSRYDKVEKRRGVREEKGRTGILRQRKQGDDQGRTPKKVLKTPQRIEEKYYAWLESPEPHKPPTKMEFAASYGVSTTVIKRLDHQYENWKAKQKAREIDMVDKKLLEKILNGHANAPDFTNYYRRHGLLVDKEEKDIRVYDGTEIARLFFEAKRRASGATSGVGQVSAELSLPPPAPCEDSEQRDGEDREVGIMATPD